ncbi:putative M10A family peptidase [Trematosphaeria pertusa]|uniref:Putative M10A family peptidase n=1 Tax=Trematosphaeria pertusa TaxID=390896 RepID=A0A6A6IW86_9PLEO|nr:putative M10A family peptidase [Trematosphaeria pertusa]KAF2254664.1 putative M10A family peptidase [Trematosphaeria pertusa]
MAKKPRTWAAPACDKIAHGDTKAVEDLKAFLLHFQYLPQEAKPGLEDVPSALKEFQRVAHIPQTGEYDAATATQLAKPRCGIPDKPGFENFAVAATRWDKFNLTYRFDTFSEELSADQVRSIISAAFAKWAAVSPFTFTEVAQGDADIRIGWYRNKHLGDGAFFDGPGRVLAHAFFPPPNGGGFAGDVHFDEDETWTAALLENTALHEIGHSLGLRHSVIPEAVMYEFANGVTQLTDDDVAGIQSIYGPFRPVYKQGDPGHGIGGYDLRSPEDRVFAFDYGHSGKLDHLCFYRPGTGTFWIIRNNHNGSFTPVYNQGDPGAGIGGYDLKSRADRAFAFDYDHNGKQDHICLYRPGTGTFWILRNRSGVFEPVYAQGDPGSGIGGFDLKSPADQAFAFDYDHTGKLDHVALYRPGTGTFWILRNRSGVFEAVYAQGAPGNGIGGFDLRSPADRAFAFDYTRSGRKDHVCLYRPGTGTFWILQNGAGVFNAVYAQGDPGHGIGGYDLKAPIDQAFAYDSDKLVLYRPGKGAVFVLRNNGGSFEKVYAQGDQADQGRGIGGFDLRSGADRAVDFDFESKGRTDHLVFVRPGTGTIWILKK